MKLRSLNFFHVWEGPCPLSDVVLEKKYPNKVAKRLCAARSALRPAPQSLRSPQRQHHIPQSHLYHEAARRLKATLVTCPPHGLTFKTALGRLGELCLAQDLFSGLQTFQAGSE